MASMSGFMSLDRRVTCPGATCGANAARHRAHFTTLLSILWAIALSATNSAHAEPADSWPAPFGGTFAVTFALASEYSYRGVSQTQRQPAVQGSFGYASPDLLPGFAVKAYGNVWASNVSLPPTAARAELDLAAGLRGMAFDNKMMFDVGYVRVIYPGATASLHLDYSVWQVELRYDFGFAQVLGTLHYSPDYYADSGPAWDKWGSLAVPLPFLHLGDASFALYAAVGNLYVERNLNFGIPNHDYFNWEPGGTLTLWGFTVSLAYVSTNLSIADCGNTTNCAGRVVLTISKAFGS